MKYPKILSLLVLALLLTACQQQPVVPQAEYDRIVAERDSQAVEMQQMSSLINAVNSSIDQISQQEGMLFINSEDGKPVSKKEMVERLKAFQTLISEQRYHIDSLQNLVTSNKHNILELKKVISALQTQLAEKQLHIADLEEELKTKNTNIRELQNKVEVVAVQLEEKKEDYSFLEEVASTQDAIINEGYFIIASKKELKDLGLISGVFKKKANYANIDKSHFTRIDIREFSEIRIESEPKLITEKPESSYTITENADDSYTLRITDPTAFWAASSFLIIQAK